MATARIFSGHGVLVGEGLEIWRDCHDTDMKARVYRPGFLFLREQKSLLSVAWGSIFQPFQQRQVSYAIISKCGNLAESLGHRRPRHIRHCCGGGLIFIWSEN